MHLLNNLAHLFIKLSLIGLLATFGLSATYAQTPTQKPVIQWLVSTPSSITSGAGTMLRWHVDGADAVSIDQGIGSVQAKGTTTVFPTATKTYTLTATNSAGSVSKSHIVVVTTNANVSGGRFIEMISPVGGQRFTAPATIRTFAAAFDPTGQNCGVGGISDRCASRVDFYVDDTVMAQVPAAQSEFWVFKATFGGVGVGTHRVWARAIYTNPAAALDSEPMWITVDAPPTYAQTINLTQDVVLTGSQHYEFVGTPTGRIRINGNGHRISSSGAWTGRLTLKNVDMFNVGLLNDPTPAIDVSTNNTVQIEDSLFDSTGTVSLFLTDSATAGVRRNEFRSNMSMPEQQQPEFGADASYPAIKLAGNSSAQKFFQGNSIGLGWADFRNADNWLIGGADGEGNVVIAPRGGIWAQNMTRTTIRGNLIYHVYFGGWSQGNVMEIGGSNDILIEHNIVGGGSWPIRSLGGTLRYNLVIDAGHQWLWVTGDNASVHHNVFVGGDGDVAGIWTIYEPKNVAIYNNTIDALGVNGFRPVQVGVNSTVSMRSNAIINTPTAPGVAIDGTLNADYNLFFGQQSTPKNYADNRLPAHDVGTLNAQVNPRFLEASEPWLYDWEDLWSRRISVGQVLANYRTRYTPASGSPLIDAGDPVSVSGNDIGAVGSGLPAADDRFGLGVAVSAADVTPPVGTIQINSGAASTTQPAVTLTLAATDDTSGVVQMRFSNDGINFNAPVAFANTASWVLTSGNGIKTVFVQFRDGVGNWSNAAASSISLQTGAPSANPQLGAHVLYAQNDTFGTTPAVSPAITSQATGSTLLALSMGWLRNLSDPVDSFSNMWTKANGPNIYFSSDFYTALWTSTSARGGAGHTLTFDKQQYPAGEISMALIEVTNGNRVDTVYNLAPGSNQTPGSITVDGPATLIAVWGGDAFALNNTAVPDNGFTVIDSYLSFGNNGQTAVQVAIAVKEVAAAGTYTVNWISNPVQNCACYLIAVRNNAATSADTTPPNGTILVNGGATSTAQTAVTLTLTATDNASGVAQMRFSNDGINFSTPLAFATTATWTLTSGDGNKAVSAQFRDGAGNWSTTVTANIVLSTPPPVDATPPTGTIKINGGAAATTQTAVTLALTATDNASGVAQMRFSNDGVTFSTPVPFVTTTAWVLASGNGTKTVSVQFRDGAGNWSSAFVASIVLAVGAPPSGLVAAYGFNEGTGTRAADASGNNLAGTVSNATWAVGRFGGALKFSGQSTSRVTVASSPLLQFSTAFTLEAWVNPQVAQQSEPTLIAKEIPGNLQYVLYAKGLGVGPNVYTLSGGNYQTAAAASTIPANTWTHLAATYNGNTLSIYVNGVLTSSNTVSGSLATGSGSLRIGNNAIFGSEGYSGLIDEVRIYNRALSAAEIQTDMQTPISVP